MEEMLILLSEGLRNILTSVIEKHNCKISSDLIEADNLITSYNNLYKSAPFIEPDFINRDYSKIGSGLDCIKDQIDRIINDEVRMLSFRFNAFEISFLPKGKTPIYSSVGIWGRENRQAGKPARIVQRLIVNKYSNRDYENFSNWIRAEIEQSGEFKLVEGSEITKWYLEDNYYSECGTLGNSCMRYPECQPYFKVYEDNAKMLVCLKNNHLLGRAIVWEINGKTYMDRIYTCMDYIEPKFISYAEEHKWYHRENNCLLNSNNSQSWVSPDDNYTSPYADELKIYLEEKYEYMPYMDSFRYYDEEENSISTIFKSNAYPLSNTEGYYGENDEDSSIATCEGCGEQEYYYLEDGPDYLHWSQYDECYYCDRCSTYCTGIYDWVGNHHVIVDVFMDKDYTETFPLGHIEDDSDYVLIDEVWYSINYPGVLQNEEGEYYIKDE